MQGWYRSTGTCSTDILQQHTKMKYLAAVVLVLSSLSSICALPLADIVSNGANAFKDVVEQTAGVAGLAEHHRFSDEAAITELWDALNTAKFSTNAVIEKFTGLDHAISQLLFAINAITFTTPLLKLKMMTNPALFAQTVGPITAKNLFLLGMVPVIGGLGALQSNAYHLGQGFLNIIPPQPYY